MGVEELGRSASGGPVAAVGPLEGVVAEEGRQVGVDVLGRPVGAVAERGPVVQVQAGPLEPLDEGVEVGLTG